MYFKVLFIVLSFVFFFFSSRRRHTRWTGDWSSDVCSSDLTEGHWLAGHFSGDGERFGEKRHRQVRRNLRRVEHQAGVRTNCPGRGTVRRVEPEQSIKFQIPVVATVDYRARRLQRQRLEINPADYRRWDCRHHAGRGARAARSTCPANRTREAQARSLRRARTSVPNRRPPETRDGRVSKRGRSTRPRPNRRG